MSHDTVVCTAVLNGFLDGYKKSSRLATSLIQETSKKAVMNKLIVIAICMTVAISAGSAEDEDDEESKDLKMLEKVCAAPKDKQIKAEKCSFVELNLVSRFHL